jgi:hypothetical protein
MGSISSSALTIRHFKFYSYFTTLLAVLSGGVIYILFRPVEPLFFNWIHDMGAGNILSGIRKFSLPMLNHIPGWLIFSLPNGLWAFAYTLIIGTIWLGSQSQLRYFWLATIPILVFGYELLQLINVLPGTFCLLDTAFGLTGIFAGMYLIFKLKNRRKQHE